MAGVRKALRRILERVGIQVFPVKPGRTLVWRDQAVEEVLAPCFGEITLSEARYLGALVASLDVAGPIVEIGTLFGWSTRVLCLFKDVERDLITVDRYSWNPYQLTPEQHFRVSQSVLREAVETFRVRQLRMDKGEFFRTYEGPPPAMVFLDAGHSYESTKEDLDWATSVSAHVVCGHDYDAAQWPGVVRAVEEAGGVAERVGSLWRLRRRGD